MIRRITVIFDTDTAYIKTPYSDRFEMLIKNISGAYFDSKRECWTVPREDIGQARVCMLHCFGESDDAVLLSSK